MSTDTEQPTLPEPTATAIEPERVLVLNDDEQRMLLSALDDSVPIDRAPANHLRDRIAYGDEYLNEVDELTRVTLRKRRLEAEVRRCNKRIEALEPDLTEQWATDGITGTKHAGTGASLYLDAKIWAKLDVDTETLSKDEAEALRAQVKADAGAALVEAGLGHLVREDFNLQTLSAVFREQIKAYREEQAELPEHKRTPRAAQDFLPKPLQGLIRIDDTPHIAVRA